MTNRKLPPFVRQNVRCEALAESSQSGVGQVDQVLPVLDARPTFHGYSNTGVAKLRRDLVSDVRASLASI
jgi:hypothetical protein